MHHFRNLQDLLSIDDSDIQREMTAYMHICRDEYLEYADEEDLTDHDFNFQLATAADLDQIKALGQPEEEVIINIYCDGKSRKIHRLIFVTTVIFVNVQNIHTDTFLSNSGLIQLTHK